MSIEKRTMPLWEVLRRAQIGDYDLLSFHYTFPSYGDTDGNLYPVHAHEAIEMGSKGSWFYGVPQNPAIDASLQQARTSLDETERERLYQDIQWTIHKEVPFIPLANAPFYSATVKGLEGLHQHPLAYFYDVYANVSKPGLETLVIAVIIDVYSSSLDPAGLGSGIDRLITRQIYDGLYNLPADSMEPIPALATNYTSSDDMKEWTFSLRQGVNFHDGTPFNASSVVFTFERMMNWENTSSEYYSKEWAPKLSLAYNAIMKSAIKSVEALDPYTVKFSLTNSLPFFLKLLAFPGFAIVSPSEHIPRYPSDFATGTGPYEFGKWVAGASITLERFDGYWGAPAKTQTLIFKVKQPGSLVVYPHEGAVTDLIAEKVHVLNTHLVAPQDLELINKTENIELKGPIGTKFVKSLWINSHREPFSNTASVADPDFSGTTTHGALVRRALAYAIDREKIVQEVHNGTGEVPNSAVPSAWPGHNASFEPYSYDPEKARDILRDLGYAVKGGETGEEAGFDSFIPIVSILGAIAFMRVFQKRRRRS
ncbi:MAG: ABC transporter substrate-binding protein [Candidatus Heimdallarchaeota archaeon]